MAIIYIYNACLKISLRNKIGLAEVITVLLMLYQELYTLQVIYYLLLYVHHTHTHILSQFLSISVSAIICNKFSSVMHVVFPHFTKIYTKNQR